MAWGSLPDRRPEGDDLSEQFFWQIGGEKASEEQFFAQTAGPARPGAFARAECPQSDQLVALPDVLFPRPARETDGLVWRLWLSETRCRSILVTRQASRIELVVRWALTYRNKSQV